MAGFISTTDTVATELEILGQAVTGGVSDLDRLEDLVAVERALDSALHSATAERRQTGPGAVHHGCTVVIAAGRIALAYVQADDDMATSTSRADATATFPSEPWAARSEAAAQ